MGRCAKHMMLVADIKTACNRKRENEGGRERAFSYEIHVISARVNHMRDFAMKMQPVLSYPGIN